MTYHGREVTFVDTAGLRRQARIRDSVEYYSTLRTARVVRDAGVCLVVIDAAEGLHVQGHQGGGDGLGGGVRGDRRVQQVGSGREGHLDRTGLPARRRTPARTLPQATFPSSSCRRSPDCGCARRWSSCWRWPNAGGIASPPSEVNEAGARAGPAPAAAARARPGGPDQVRHTGRNGTSHPHPLLQPSRTRSPSTTAASS